MKDNLSAFLLEIKAFKNISFSIKIVSYILGYFHFIKFKDCDLLPLQVTKTELKIKINNTASF